MKIMTENDNETNWFAIKKLKIKKPTKAVVNGAITRNQVNHQLF